LVFSAIKKSLCRNARLFLFVLHHICILVKAQTKAVIPSRFYEEFAFRFFVVHGAFNSRSLAKSARDDSVFVTASRMGGAQRYPSSARTDDGYRNAFIKPCSTHPLLSHQLTIY
jgi:hypothetical protein